MSTSIPRRSRCHKVIEDQFMSSRAPGDAPGDDDSESAPLLPSGSPDEDASTGDELDSGGSVGGIRANPSVAAVFSKMVRLSVIGHPPTV